MDETLPSAPASSAATLDVRIGNDVHPVVLPRAPLRFLLHNAIQDSLGFTKFDREQARHLEPGERLEPTGQPDPYALQCAYYAVVGVCWAGPELPVPSLRAMRHDVVAYGEAVLEHFMVTHRSSAMAVHLVREGRKLHGLMMREVTTQLAADIEAEKGFSKAQGEASTSG